MHRILTYLSLLLALLYSTYFYYYAGAIFWVFDSLIYLLVGILLSISMLVIVLRNRKPEKVRILKMELVIVVCVSALSLMYGHSITEHVDWACRKNTRKQIVEMVKLEMLKPNVTYNDEVCHLYQWSVPPISNSGNDILIKRSGDKHFTITFFIDRGILGSYTAFIYTNNSTTISMYNDNIDNDKGLCCSQKLEENWYRVSSSD